MGLSQKSWSVSTPVATLSLQTRAPSEFARWGCHRSRGPGHTLSPNKGTIRICKTGLSQKSWSVSTPVATLYLRTRTLPAFPRRGCHRSRSPFPHTPSWQISIRKMATVDSKPPDSWLFFFFSPFLHLSDRRTSVTYHPTCGWKENGIKFSLQD